MNESLLGTVGTISSKCNLSIMEGYGRGMIVQRMVVLPALSRPMMMILICSVPKSPLNSFENTNPILILIN